MSANNILIIIKGEDGKFRGYHRDFDGWTEGQYDEEQICPKCGGEGSIENSPVTIRPCDQCLGGGRIPIIEETPIFEADTVEGAIHAYDKWLEKMNDNEDGFPFYVEYGYQFVGLGPNPEKALLGTEKMIRQEVYKLIDREREYQKFWDEKRKTEPCGGGAQLLDKDKPVESWILWMEQYLSLAREAATKSINKIAALENIRKVVAMGVACMEYNETPPRKEVK